MNKKLLKEYIEKEGFCKVEVLSYESQNSIIHVRFNYLDLDSEFTEENFVNVSFIDIMGFINDKIDKHRFYELTENFLV